MGKYTGRVGKGWLPLLDELDAKLRALGWTGAAYVKEKYAHLDFHPRSITGVPEEQQEEFFALIDEYEWRSWVICEDCGAPGEERDVGGWYRTLCLLCNAQAQRGRGAPPLTARERALIRLEATAKSYGWPSQYTYQADGEDHPTALPDDFVRDVLVDLRHWLAVHATDPQDAWAHAQEMAVDHWESEQEG
jgi:hypothetical protein